MWEREKPKFSFQQSLYISDKFIPMNGTDLPKNFIVVIDNAPCHSVRLKDAPSNSRKGEMTNVCLHSENINF